MKRIFDLCLSIILLPLAVPPIMIALVLVKLDSPGPAIFKQQRVGLHEKIFTVFKIRTMSSDMDDRPSHEATQSSITKIGKFLRRSKIDELPQLLNVITGDMSFVGPRPCLPIQVDLIEARRKLGVFASPPGITGLGQVLGYDMSDPELLASTDRQYLDKRSFTYDIILLAKTFTGSGSGDRIRKE
ncbi:MAG: sugar transferase [Parasphingorhabdus sp.]